MLSSFRSFCKVAQLASEEKKGNNVINLGIGQPDFPTPQNVVEAAIKALRDGHHGYTSSNGIKELRSAVADLNSLIPLDDV